MSVKLMSAVWETDLQPTRKMVLLALCDNANDEGLCYPSITTIAKKCSLSRRAVINAIEFLEEKGFLTREKRDGSVTTYHITNPCIWRTSAPDAPVHEVHPTGAPDAPPPVHEVHRSRRPLYIEPSIEPSKNRQVDTPPTPPQGGHEVPPAPSSKPQQNQQPEPIALPPWLPQDLWDEFIAHRKAMRSPLTAHAQKLAIKKLDELRRDGHDPRAVIEQTILNGWKSFYPLRTNATRSDERAAFLRSITESARGPKQSSNWIDITDEVQVV